MFSTASKITMFLQPFCLRVKFGHFFFEAEMLEIIAQASFSAAVGNCKGSVGVLAKDLVRVIHVDGDPLGICAFCSNRDGLIVC